MDKNNKDLSLPEELLRENIIAELKIIRNLTSENMLNLSFANKILSISNENKISNDIVEYFNYHEFKTLLGEDLCVVIIINNIND